MRICFVSNYINHHQIPFCNAMAEQTKGQFVFIQTEPMEEERVRMGWQADCPAYVHHYAREEEWCKRQILDCDVLLFGGCDDESYIQERLLSGRMIIRISERLYKTGQWRAVSPRGLVQKYKDHFRYRKAPVYLLCAGGYVASDFHIVGAYPGKMFCWGYFPETRHYDMEELLENKGFGTVPYLLWAARFIDWKHPERAVEAARYLKEKGLRFHLDMVGGGPLEEDVRTLIHAYGLEDWVSLLGYRRPDQVRELMEKADIFLMTSDRQEGWGAVANEAMNSGCALVADHMVGAAPYLIRQGYNGYVYQSGNQEMLNAIAEKLLQEPRQRRVLGRRAYETITNIWNAERAARELMGLIGQLIEDFCEELEGKKGQGLAKGHAATGKYAMGQAGTLRGGQLAPCMLAPMIPESRPVPPAVFVAED